MHPRQPIEQQRWRHFTDEPHKRLALLLPLRVCPSVLTATESSRVGLCICSVHLTEVTGGGNLLRALLKRIALSQKNEEEHREAGRKGGPLRKATLTPGWMTSTRMNV